MIKLIRSFRRKYEQLQKNSEYVAIGQVVNDLYRLEQEARLKRIPKRDR